MNKYFYIVLVLCCTSCFTNAQTTTETTKNVSNFGFWMPSDTLSKPRFRIGTGFALASYSIASIGLYNAWYKEGISSKFHYFDDRQEWEYMDKFGHGMSAYFQSNYAFKLARWSGLSENISIATGAISSIIIQSTIELMDGFSDKWGFSKADVAMNLVGVTCFAAQQRFWHEQRIKFKVSSSLDSYSDNPIPSTDGLFFSSKLVRSKSLFGVSLIERFLKDYNAQTYWVSINIKSFLLKKSRFPSYINIALGYGAENMYGGFNNAWTEQGHDFILDTKLYPRYHQFYIGLDLDLDKIQTDNYLLKSIFSMFNIFKLPLPAVEFNTKGEVIFHLFKA